MESLEQIGIKAKKASRYLAKLGIDEKNKALEAVADALTANAESIIAANEKDLVNAKANGMKPALIDRLTLDVKRINAMADGIRVLTGLEDPVGEVTGMKKRRHLICFRRYIHFILFTYHRIPYCRFIIHFFCNLDPITLRLIIRIVIIFVT